jgi:DNA uptake protein ComE-like DNA-binding protein
MNIVKSFLSYTTSQRSGIFILLTVTVILQSFAFFVRDTNTKEPSDPEKQQWLSLQKQIDAVKVEKLAKIKKVYPFNPNFISDYKGYQLGMSVEEIDRLHQFRKTNRYVNSAKEFQGVTLVSDSLLKVIAPYFKFPEWVGRKKEFKTYPKQTFDKKEKLVVLDINQATQEDLKKVYGIGEALSLRILKEKEKLGGFVSMEQMQDIWGLSPEVIENLNKSFKISVQPDINKLPINKASIKELMQFPYFKYSLAKAIVTYRSMNGDIKNIEDLAKVKGFPVEKVNIIGLYLEF